MLKTYLKVENSDIRKKQSRVGWMAGYREVLLGTASSQLKFKVMFGLSFTEKVTFEQRFKGGSESHGLLRKVHFFTARANSTKSPKKGHDRPAQLQEH